MSNKHKSKRLETVERCVMVHSAVCNDIVTKLTAEARAAEKDNRRGKLTSIINEFMNNDHLPKVSNQEKNGTAISVVALQNNQSLVFKLASHQGRKAMFILGICQNGLNNDDLTTYTKRAQAIFTPKKITHHGATENGTCFTEIVKHYATVNTIV